LIDETLEFKQKARLIMKNAPLTEDTKMYLHYCKDKLNPGDTPSQGVFLEQGEKCPYCGAKMPKRGK